MKNIKQGIEIFGIGVSLTGLLLPVSNIYFAIPEDGGLCFILFVGLTIGGMFISNFPALMMDD